MTRRKVTLRALLAAIAGSALLLGSYRAGRDTAARPVLVWVTSQGSVYHREGCRYLRSGGIRTPLEGARGRYRPCKVCGPPR